MYLAESLLSSSKSFPLYTYNLLVVFGLHSSQSVLVEDSLIALIVVDLAFSNKLYKYRLFQLYENPAR